MSTLYKRSGSPCWYGKFQIGRERHRFSTGEANKAKAETILRQRMDQARGQLMLDEMVMRLDQAIGQMPVSKRDAARQQAVHMLLAGLDKKLELDHAWETWSASPRKRNPREATQEWYHAIWRRFRNWLSARHPEVSYLHDVDAMTAEAYAADLWGSRVSPRTYNAHLNFLGRFVDVLKLRSGVTSNVWRSLPRMEGRTESRREFRPEELEKVVSEAQGTLRIMLLVGAYTGMRLGDACLLKWEYVDFKASRIVYEPRKTQRKNKTVTVPMHGVLGAALQGVRPEQASGYVFPEAASLYLRDRRAIAKRFRRHFESCGIVTTEPSSTRQRQRAVARVGFHSLRHSFVSLCAASGVPQVALMELVGHSSPAMTRLYSHASAEQKVKAIEQLPTLGLVSKAS